MAQPVEIFGDIKGMTRDFSVDALPQGYLWNLVDAIPVRKGSKIDIRGGWTYHGASAFPATIWGGYYAAFTKGQRLLVVASSAVYDVDITTGTYGSIGSAPATMLQNGVKLNDRVYFMDGQGLTVPVAAAWTGSTPNVVPVSTAPKGKVGIAYKGRLVLGGDPADPSGVRFSEIETEGGPLGTWDAISRIGTNQEVTGLAGMASQIIVFHPAAVERIRGTIPPYTGNKGDMYVETLTDQVGCVQPQTIVPWRENVIFADERGVFITDGATVRNLTEQGGIGDFWRQAYGSRIAGAPSVSCGTFLDYLLVNLLCMVEGNFVSYTLVCDLSTRAWFRFRNYAATCYIPSESATEESYCGNYQTNRLMKTSPMFQDPVTIPTPAPDYVDGDGDPVMIRVATGFKKVSKDEGRKRIRFIYVSYHHQSSIHGIDPNGLRVEYLIDPPIPEENDPVTGDPTGWVLAGHLPDAHSYTRKRLPVGKDGYGIMVRVQGISTSRTSELFSIGVETTTQDRGKVTA